MSPRRALRGRNSAASDGVQQHQQRLGVLRPGSGAVHCAELGGALNVLRSRAAERSADELQRLGVDRASGKSGFRNLDVATYVIKHVTECVGLIRVRAGALRRRSSSQRGRGGRGCVALHERERECRLDHVYAASRGGIHPCRSRLAQHVT